MSSRHKPPSADPADNLAEREGKRIAAMVDDDFEFFVCDVACGDVVADVERTGQVFAEHAPNVGIVMLAAGPKRLVVHARVPASRASVAGCAYRLVAEALVDVPHVNEEGMTDLSATACVFKDESMGRDPFADKDTARSAVAEYMNESGLFGDSESEVEDEENAVAE